MFKVSTSSSTLSVSSDVQTERNMVKLVLDKKNQTRASRSCKERKYNGPDHQKFGNINTTASTRVSGSLPSNTIANPKGDVKAITTRSGVSYNGPQISSPPKEKENETPSDKDKRFNQCTEKHPNLPVVQTNDQIGEPVVASKTKPTLPYPSRANKEKLREKDNLLASKFMEIFRNLQYD
ncbi:hypothetical protein Tco_0002084 [Tanacetum coccineum]